MKVIHRHMGTIETERLAPRLALFARLEGGAMAESLVPQQTLFLRVEDRDRLGLASGVGGSSGVLRLPPGGELREAVLEGLGRRGARLAGRTRRARLAPSHPNSTAPLH